MSNYFQTCILKTACAPVFAMALVLGLGVCSANAEYVQWTGWNNQTSSGNMETGNGGWESTGGVSLATDYSVSATHSLKLEKLEGNADCMTYTRGNGGYWPIAVTAGQTYTFCWDQKYSLTSGAFVVSLYGNGDQLVDQSINSGTSGNGGADFDHVSREITIPTGITGLQINVRAAMSWYDNSVGNGSTIWLDNFSLSQVPEPSTMALAAAGLLGLLAYAWRKQK